MCSCAGLPTDLTDRQWKLIESVVRAAGGGGEAISEALQAAVLPRRWVRRANHPLAAPLATAGARL